MSVMIQVLLPDELARELEKAAAKLHLPVDELAREAVREKLSRIEQRASSQRFLEKYRGIIDSPETDLASRVDEILYGGDPHK